MQDLKGLQNDNGRVFLIVLHVNCLDHPKHDTTLDHLFYDVDIAGLISQYIQETLYDLYFTCLERFVHKQSG